MAWPGLVSHVGRGEAGALQAQRELKEPGQGPHNQLGEQMVSFQLIPETSEAWSEIRGLSASNQGSSFQQSQQTGAHTVRPHTGHATRQEDTVRACGRAEGMVGKGTRTAAEATKASRTRGIGLGPVRQGMHLIPFTPLRIPEARGLALWL